MKTIPIGRGLEALVDDEDWDRLSQFAWFVFPGYHTMYAKRHLRVDGRRTSTPMHKDVYQPPPGHVIDHKDGNGLNNQRSNLRAATNAQNTANSGAYGLSSRWRGVWLDKRPGNHKPRWGMGIKHGEVKIRTRFNREENAATAYNFWAEELFGEFARMNRADEGLEVQSVLAAYPVAAQALIEQAALEMGADPELIAAQLFYEAEDLS